MVARLIEGWESSTALADYTGKWTVLTAQAIGSGFGRFGNGVQLTSTNSQLSRTLDNQATWVVGFALRPSGFDNANRALVSFLDGAVVHCGVAYQASTGILFAWRGTTATVLGAPAGALTANAWNYVEVKVTISDTVGVVAVRLGGASVLNLTAQDTRNAGNATANIVQLGPGGSMGALSLHYDDIYILDATGTVNNDFLGDCKVEQLLPNGAGATTAWTPSAGSNYTCVDDVPPNGDTDYVSSATAGQTDTYAYGDLSVATSGTVKAVQATASCRKDDAGARTLALVARPGSTDRVGATQSVLDTYSMLAQVWDQNPDTSTAWTVAAVNASSFGQRLIS